MNPKNNEPLKKANGEPIRDSVGRFIYPSDPELGLPLPYTLSMDDETLDVIFQHNDSLRERYKIQNLLERNAELEKTQECWGECNCKEKSKGTQ